MLALAANQWPADAFWEVVEEAVRLVLKEETGASDETIRALTLGEWLAYSYPAGNG